MHKCCLCFSLKCSIIICQDGWYLYRNYPKSIKIHHRQQCSHVYQIHQTPSSVFVGFGTTYSQAMDALHLLLYRYQQNPTIGVLFYCTLMDFGGFWTVSSQNAFTSS